MIFEQTDMTQENIETRFAVHEAVCAERYQKIEDRLNDGSKRMKNIEIMLYIIIAAVLLGPGAAAMFIKKLLGI